MRKATAAVFLMAAAIAILGCGGGGVEGEAAGDAGTEARIVRAIAYIDPKSGSETSGTAIFINEGEQVSLQIDISNAPPGEHAAHIHEFGDCSAEDGTSAGGHWNPTASDHGQWEHAPFHLGDIGNITVGEDGKGSLTLSTDRWAMGGGGDNDIMGKSVIVHAKADDFTSQPTGAAGGRIGCGVIE